MDTVRLLKAVPTVIMMQLCDDFWALLETLVEEGDDDVIGSALCRHLERGVARAVLDPHRPGEHVGVGVGLQHHGNHLRRTHSFRDHVH